MKATTQGLDIGLYEGFSYDENNYAEISKSYKVTGTDSDAKDFLAYTDVTEITYKGGVLSLGDGKDVVLADKYTIFVNDDGDGKTTVPGSLAKDFNETEYADVVYVFEDDNDEAVEIYVYKDAEADKTEEDETDAKVESLDLSAKGKITINLNTQATKETEYTVALSQLRDSGYVEVASYKVTVAKDAQKGELDISSSLVSGQTYQVTYGDLKDTVAYTK